MSTSVTATLRPQHPIRHRLGCHDRVTQPVVGSVHLARGGSKMAGLVQLGGAVVAESASKLFLEGAVVAFQGLSLSVCEHDVLCIVGPSGCGKTTFLRCVAGLTELSAGRLLVHGTPVIGPPEGVAMVFQQFGLLPWKTVFDNAAFGLAMVGASSATIRERVTHYLDLV